PSRSPQRPKVLVHDIADIAKRFQQRLASYVEIRALSYQAEESLVVVAHARPPHGGRSRDAPWDAAAVAPANDLLPQHLALSVKRVGHVVDVRLGLVPDVTDELSRRVDVSPDRRCLAKGDDQALDAVNVCRVARQAVLLVEVR